MASVIGKPVTETTDPGGSPARTRSSTRATARRPLSGSKGVVSHCTSRRVNHTVSATAEISSSNCTAVIPAPTTATVFAAKGSAVR
ncbi:hypothetical protein TSOC111612_17490 [Tsukamurella ocularis]